MELGFPSPSSSHGLGWVDLPDTDLKRVYPPLARIPRSGSRKRLQIADLNGYIYNSQLPGYFDRKRMTFTRGGLADLLHEFERSHTRKYRVQIRMGNVFQWAQDCDSEFRAGRVSWLYENIPANFPCLSERFVDLRSSLEQRGAGHSAAWSGSFRPEALRSMGFGGGRPILRIPIDYSCPALNYNIDLLEALGVPLPIRTWADLERCLERCADADYVWPIALFNAPGADGIRYFTRAIQSMVMRCLISRLDFDRDGIVDRRDWRRVLERRRFHEKVEPYVESLRLLKRLSRYFVWYANRYDSLHVKPLYFSRRPQCLFRAGDFRRVRADMELYETIQGGRRLFPFREGAMHLPEITRETSPFASGPAPMPHSPSLWLSVTRQGQSRSEIDAGIRFLQFFTSKRSQTFFTRWSYTVSATRDVPLPPVYGESDVVFRSRELNYMGLTPAGQAIWKDAIRRFIEPEGDLKTMLSETRRALDTDLKSLREEERETGPR
ncbi:MAG: hypothetical protein HYT87_07740 [Nitrospirae bacterium]|nr:hypothetical protein [Nitrospirota bacterium]